MKGPGAACRGWTTVRRKVPAPDAARHNFRCEGTDGASIISIMSRSFHLKKKSHILLSCSECYVNLVMFSFIFSVSWLPILCWNPPLFLSQVTCSARLCFPLLWSMTVAILSIIHVHLWSAFPIFPVLHRLVLCSPSEPCSWPCPRLCPVKSDFLNVQILSFVTASQEWILVGTFSVFVPQMSDFCLILLCPCCLPLLRVGWQMVFHLQDFIKKTVYTICTLFHSSWVWVLILVPQM